MSILIAILMICCGSTILLEAIPILFLTDKKAWWKASVVCNVVTNPLMNTIMLLVFLIADLMIIVIIMLALEVVVVFVEAYFYQRMMNKKYLECFMFSFAANVFSFLAGMFFAHVLF